MEHYREEKRQRQIANAGKRKREEDESASTGMEREMQTRTGGEMGSGSGMEGGAEKRARVGTAGKSDEGVESGREIVPLAPPEDATPTSAIADSSQADLPAKLNRSKVSPDVRGHTSYLTFARLVPFPLPLPPPGPSTQDEDRLVPEHVPEHAC